MPDLVWYDRHLVGFENRLKDENRVKDKIAESLAVKGRTVDEAVQLIPDAIRYAFQYHEADYGRHLREDTTLTQLVDSYITDLVSRDVRQISDIERPAEMRRLLGVSARRMGNLAVAQAIAGAVGMPRQTLSRYLDLLELAFVIRRIPGWSSNLTRRAVSVPKLVVTDSGLAGRLIGLSPGRAADQSAPVGS